MDAPKYLAFDTETVGLNRHDKDYMFAFSTCDWNGTTTVHRLDGRASRVQASRAEVERIWSDRSIEKLMHNARFDTSFTEKLLGHSLRGQPVHETMALSHIFNNQHPSHGLDDVMFDLCRYPRDQDVAVRKYLNRGRGLQDCPEWKLDKYQRADAERTMLLFRHYYPKLKADGHDYREIYEMERALVWTTLGIENRGIMVSRTRTGETIGWLEREADKALQDFQRIVHRRVRPTPRVVQMYLYKELGLPVLKATKTGGESVDKHVIAELRQKHDHPVFDALLRYRSYTRGQSILQSYLDLADDDGIIHPSIHPYQARTGRESCSKPNLQNVEKETTLLNPFPVPARRAFRPKPGYVNYHVDYSGIEMRLLVHYAQDPEYIEIFRRGEDPQAAAAEMFYGTRFTQAKGKLRKSLRDAAKNTNYAIPYGAGLDRVAGTLGMEVHEVEGALRRYRQRFAGLLDLNKRDSAEVRATGCVSTIFGRRLALARGKPHKGTNYRIQGTAAGILKRAQNRVDDYLRSATGGEAGIILPIHDELIVEWPRKRLSEAPGCLRDIRKIMIDFPQFSVPMEVECKVSTRDWATLKEVEIPR